MLISRPNGAGPISSGQASGAQQHIFVSSRPVSSAASVVRPDTSNQLVAPDAGEPDNYSAADTDGGGQGSGEGAPGAPDDEFECPNNGIFADVASGCQSYHVCQSGAQVQEKFQCPLGTLFNNIILTCDFAHNVQCSQHAASTQRPAADTVPTQNEARRLMAPRTHQHQTAAPRAPVHTSQAGYARPTAHQSQRTAPGPRQLVIGAGGLHERPRHQQPAPTTPEPAGATTDDDDNDNESVEPVEPLVPATLPARASSGQHQHQHQNQHQHQHQLPYIPPPAPQQPPARHSAHLSQYPASTGRPQQQQHQARADRFRANGVGDPASGYDGASSASPVFASRDEQPGPSTTEASASAPAQSFNLVINHVTPTRSNEHKGAQVAGDVRAVDKLGGQHQPVGAHTPAPIHKSPTRAKETQLQQQLGEPAQAASSRAPPPNGAKRLPAHGGAQPAPRATLNQRYESQRQAQHAGGAGQQQQQLAAPAARPQAPAGYAPEASQAAVTHRPPDGLVDLTNGKQSAGVSSEALNDGLLLIVRHSSGSGPILVAGASEGLSPAEGPGASGRRAATSGQAYAVDPALVSPNSALDAQLFPNVQRVLASSRHESFGHEGAPAPQAARSPYMQHVAPAASGTQAQRARLAGPLAPMEPASARPNGRQPGDQVALESGSGKRASQLTSGGQPLAKQQNQKQQTRIKRTRRLKAAQSPGKPAAGGHSAGATPAPAKPKSST